MARPKFKYFEGDSQTIEMILKEKPLKWVLEEFNLREVTFPLPSSCLRVGSYYYNGFLYLVRPDGKCYLQQNFWFHKDIYTYHLFSQTEYQLLQKVIEIFGIDSLSSKLRDRWNYHNRFVNMNRYRLEFLVLRQKIINKYRN